MSQLTGLAASALVGALAVAPLVVSTVVPTRPGATVVSQSALTTTPSTPAVNLPPYQEAPFNILDLKPTHQLRDPAAGWPERVTIPSLRVSVPVVPIAMSNGALEPPGDFYTWGWWSGGAVPGAATGSAVITGHNVNGLSVPMTNLDKTKVGALVTVTTPNGKIRYRVTAVRIIRKTTLPSLAGNVFSQDVPGRLVLVTCDTWNGWEHLTNAVVIAVPVHARFG